MFTIALSWPVNEDELRKLYGYVADTCRIVSPKSHDIDDLFAVAPAADAIVGGFIPEKMIDNAPKAGFQNVDAFVRGLTPPNLVDLSTQA